MTLEIFFGEAVWGAILSVLQMAAIIIPIMIGIEILRDIKILDWISFLGRPLTSVLKISRDASLPLLAGLVFGIVYGAGIIIQSAREGRLQSRDLYIVNTFLVICHSVIEDTLLFAAIGANLTVILGWRVVLAILICMVLSLFLKPVPLTQPHTGSSVDKAAP